MANLDGSREWKTFWADLMDKPATPMRLFIEEQARKKMYHDFKSSVAAPKLTLRAHLLTAGYDDMAEKVLLGEYDF